MTKEQALKEIQSRPKWYHIVNSNGNIDHSVMIKRMQRIKKGVCSEHTKRKFFEHYGYEYKIKEEVIKK